MSKNDIADTAQSGSWTVEKLAFREIRDAIFEVIKTKVTLQLIEQLQLTKHDHQMMVSFSDDTAVLVVVQIQIGTILPVDEVSELLDHGTRNPDGLPQS